MLYGWAGAPYPYQSLVLVTVVCALMGAGLWMFLGSLWQKDQPPGAAQLAASIMQAGNVKIYEPFLSAYLLHGAALGRPTDSQRVIPLREIYVAGHEHAIVIWTYFNTRFYRLGLDGELAGKWTSRPDPEFADSNRPEWRDDAALRRRFRTPTSADPPFAGIALRWSRDPESWQWIGWRRWQWNFEPTDSWPAYQEFERGMIIGGLSYAAGSDPQVFVLINDGPDSGRWDSRTLLGITKPVLREPR